MAVGKSSLGRVPKTKTRNGGQKSGRTYGKQGARGANAKGHGQKIASEQDICGGRSVARAFAVRIERNRTFGFVFLWRKCDKIVYKRKNLLYTIGRRECV